MEAHRAVEGLRMKDMGFKFEGLWFLRFLTLKDIRFQHYGAWGFKSLDQGSRVQGLKKP